MTKNKMFKGTLLLLSLTIAFAFAFSFSVVNAKSPYFQIAGKEKLKSFYEANNEIFEDHIPQQIFAKHKDVIEKVDVLLSELPDSITSKSNNFSLNYYGELIQIGVRL